jgi:predicted nucleotidyltransferase
VSEQLPLRLWSVVVGSQAFGVAHDGSDYDVFACYVAPTTGILSGAVKQGGCHVSEGVMLGRKMDLQVHELSRWVDGAMDENLNYMLGLFSPIPLEDPNGLLAELRDIVSSYPSTAILASTLGMARSNFKKFERHMASGDERRAQKNLRTSMRSLKFAKRFIYGVRRSDLFMVDIADRTRTFTLDDVRREMETLEEVAERSGLPARADSTPFLAFQLKVRMAELEGNLKGLMLI